MSPFMVGLVYFGVYCHNTTTHIHKTSRNMFDFRTQKSVKTILVGPLQGEFPATVPNKATRIMLQKLNLKYAFIKRDCYTN